jgi:hypothetical protein
MTQARDGKIGQPRFIDEVLRDVHAETGAEFRKPTRARRACEPGGLA